MDPVLKDRFKALKILSDELYELEEHKESEMHATAVMFEQLYGDIYRQRNDVINDLEILPK
jgi:hypothetical protein